MSDTFSKVEVITGVARGRRFSTDLKLAVIAETMQPGMSISYVARRHGLSPSLVFRWRRLMSEGGREAVRADGRRVRGDRVVRCGGRAKTLKRDYVRVTLIPNAAAALALVDSWMEDYNTVHPHSRLGYRSPREYILSQPVACPA